MTTTLEPPRRLHPVSILFRMAQQVRAFAVPALLAIFGARSAFASAEIFAFWLIIPFAAFSLLRHAFFSYRTAEHELEVRSGVLVRNVRHVPYSRIHDLTAVQNVFHRLFGVVEARVETGAGNKPEATLSVISRADYEALRRLVFSRREGLVNQAAEESELDSGRTLLHLTWRDTALWGLLRGQVGLVLAALAGGAWQFGEAGPGSIAGRLIPNFFRDVVREPTLTRDRVVVVGVTILGLLLALRLLSMAWTMVRFHGFRLTLVGDDVKTEFGLLTRVSASLPNHRIQAVVVRESPLQRRLGRVSVRAQTAGGSAGGGELDGETGQQSAESASLKDREWLAPILRRDDLATFLAPILGGFDLSAPDWQPVHPRAVRRAFKSWLRILAVPVIALAPFLRWWTLAPAAVLLAWGWLAARGEIAGLRWAVSGDNVLVRSGWLWRRLIIVPIDRVQTVTLHSSPWDRRARMARVSVDTAGGGALGSPFEIPYLADDVAIDLAARLECEVAARPFRW